MGWPATNWYCLGSAAVAKPPGTAREPVPAHGITAQKRPWADKGAGGVGSKGAVMGRTF